MLNLAALVLLICVQYDYTTVLVFFFVFFLFLFVLLLFHFCLCDFSLHRDRRVSEITLNVMVAICLLIFEVANLSLQHGRLVERYDHLLDYCAG